MGLLLVFDRVSKTYRVGLLGRKAIRAVQGVSFEIHSGEVVSLVGESGSGKTTIGKMILRLIPVTSGKIFFQGVDIATLQGEALKGYYQKVQGVFQDPYSSCNPIFKADRIFWIIRDEFFPKVSTIEWARKVNKTLEAVGLNPEHVLSKFPHQLSGGQLQRFLIARALLLNIELLVADEIISMLDASTRVDVLNLLAGLKAQGLSLLFITHDLSLGYYISDWSVILYGGRIVEQGVTERVYHRPLHPYTRMLMNSVPRLDKKWERGTGIYGIDQQSGGGGCVYYGRCPIAKKSTSCACEEQVLVEVEQGHFVACTQWQ